MLRLIPANQYSLTEQLLIIIQGHSKQSGWSGFCRTNISLGKNKIPFSSNKQKVLG